MIANIPDKYTFNGVDLSETTVNTMHTHREFMDTLSRALTAERELAELKERIQGVHSMICRELAEPPDSISTEFAQRILALLAFPEPPKAEGG